MNFIQQLTQLSNDRCKVFLMLGSQKIVEGRITLVGKDFVFVRLNQNKYIVPIDKIEAVTL